MQHLLEFHRGNEFDEVSEVDGPNSNLRAGCSLAKG